MSKEIFERKSRRIPVATRKEILVQLSIKILWVFTRGISVAISVAILM